MDSGLDVSFFVRALAAGVIGTTGMYAAMWAINRSGLASANMTRALGSLITKNYDSALVPGIALQFGTGAFIGIAYASFLALFPVQSFLVGPLFGYQELMLGPMFAYSILGLAAGVLHGLVVSAVLVILVAERHPLPQFREAGFEVAAAHVAGHIIYGLSVGLALGALR